MQQLASNQYETVTVTTRDETIKMPADSGLRLMKYLTSDNPSSHVMITTVNGEQVVVNKNDIRKVSPTKSQVTSYKTPDQLGLTADVTDKKGDGYKRWQELRAKVAKELQ